MKGYEVMKLKKIIAAAAAFSLITSFTASAAGSFFTEKQLSSQSDFFAGCGFSRGSL